ncbi:hypothetical protein E4U13_002821 [Claviceps humidiphila]|uniref:Uncharacterized protein n=1 Tax=Claviceps humidiphila TaxID=1294629 RepID=A0A9P7TU79_9HYPO|nr:hypothetical protein E4U13_002821 [Claviceps humidiphila]
MPPPGPSSLETSSSIAEPRNPKLKLYSEPLLLIPLTFPPSQPWPPKVGIASKATEDESLLKLGHNCCGIPSHRQKAEFKELQARLANANANILLAHAETDRLLRVLTPTPTPTPPSPHHRTRAAGVSAEDIDDIHPASSSHGTLCAANGPSNNEDESSAELSSGKDQGIAIILV